MGLSVEIKTMFLRLNIYQIKVKFAELKSKYPPSVKPIL
jgi:hypothetical protein